jgi:hypothetical protein
MKDARTPVFDLPPDARALGFTHPDALPEELRLPVLELLRHALDVDGAFSYDPAHGMLLGVRREVILVEAAVASVDPDELRMALHGLIYKLDVAIALHRRQVAALRAEVSPSKAPRRGARRARGKRTAMVVRHRTG